MDPIAHIQRLGWEWSPDGAGTGLGPGVVLSVKVSGRVMRAFVPLSRVWLTFDQELQGVGCVGSAWVGEPFSCVGFFGFIKKAAKSLGRAASSLVPKAITRAASSVVNSATRYAGQAYSAATRVPVLGSALRASTALMTLPARAAQQLLSGGRIDRIAVDQFKTALSSAKTLAPYVQTVVSFVPGVGQGVSAGIGAGVALAQGKTIDQALVEGVKASLPGGPLAQAALSVAMDVAQGKPVDQIAINALPIDPNAKIAMLRGVAAARDLAAGKPVDQVVIDQAVRSLPPAAQKAVQIGVALGHAKNLQGAAGAAVHGASQLAGDYSRGVAAAHQFARGVRSQPVLHALNRAYASRGALTQIVQHAQQGNPQAGRIVNALSMMRAAPATAPRGLFAALSRHLPPPARAPSGFAALAGRFA